MSNLDLSITTFQFRAYPTLGRTVVVLMIAWPAMVGLAMLIPWLLRGNYQLLPLAVMVAQVLFPIATLALLYFSGPRRVLHIGHGMLVFSSTSQELARIPLRNLARARVYSRNRRPLIELTDCFGQVLEIHGFPPLRLADHIADQLASRLPHHVAPSRQPGLLSLLNSSRTTEFYREPL